MMSVLVIIVSILLILVVLVQNSKGGGIQSQFGAANQIMGVQRGSDIIEKLTWGFAGALLFFSLLLTPTTNSTEVNANNASSTKKRAQSAIQTPQNTNPGTLRAVPKANP